MDIFMEDALDINVPNTCTKFKMIFKILIILAFGMAVK